MLMFWGPLQVRATLRSLCHLPEDVWSCLVDGAFSSHRVGPVPAWGSCWGALMATAQAGGTEGHQSLVSYCDALPCGLSSSSFWHLPCCEPSTLQRGAGKSPSASPGQCPKPFLMFLRDLPASSSPDGGTPSLSSDGRGQTKTHRGQSSLLGTLGANQERGSFPAPKEK